MNFNKKAFIPGWEYIAAFFIAGIMFVLVVGMYDFSIVEMYEPVHGYLNESLTSLGINRTNLAYDKFEDNYTEVHNKSLPFNLLYIFVFFVSISMSVVNVAKQKKMDAMELLFKSIGGLVFFIWLMQIVVFKVVTYFKIQIIDYLFTDLIVSYIPFYLTIYNNAGVIILGWGVVLLIVNWYFGETQSSNPFDNVFGGGGFK